jgi:hypothetical protein
MNGRSARARHQDITASSSSLQCGLPQESPVSPILFLLYTEPTYRLGNTKRRFWYAEGTAILCVGDSVEATAVEAAKSIDELATWGGQRYLLRPRQDGGDALL